MSKFFLITNKCNDNQPRLVSDVVVKHIVGGWETILEPLIPMAYKESWYIDRWSNDLSTFYARDVRSDRVLLRIEEVSLDY